MLEVHEVTRSFGAQQILRGVSFELKPHCLAGLIGPGGGGKSTLLKIMGGVARLEQGRVHFGSAAGHRVSLMFQEGALFDSLNVFDNVAFPLVHGRVPTFRLPKTEQYQVHEKVDAILAEVGLSAAAYKMPGQLSGGMRRRVSLARALVSRPDLVLLDDPTAGLDPVASSVIMDLIVKLHKEFKPTLVMVSQDLRRLLPVVDTIVALFDGKIRFIGNLIQLKEFDCPNVRKFVSCRYDL
jgi:phospholipid/cholesterol/gamma-HCH transport system ATP-binding protein